MSRAPKFVYVVLDLHIDGSSIVGVFATSEAAHQFMGNCDSKKYECLDLEVHEVLSEGKKV